MNSAKPGLSHAGEESYNAMDVTEGVVSGPTPNLPNMLVWSKCMPEGVSVFFDLPTLSRTSIQQAKDYENPNAQSGCK